MGIFQLPGGIRTADGPDLFFGPTAGQHALADCQRARSPLAQAMHVGAAQFANDIDVEGVAPRNETGLIFERWFARDSESTVIVSPVFKAVRSPGDKWPPYVSK